MSQNYSPGLEGVTAGISAVSEVDAERNALCYRGLDIHDLVEHCTFDETAFLLLHGRLPSPGEYGDFLQRIAGQRNPPPEVWEVFARMPASTHPMDALRTAVSLLGTFDQSGSSPQALLAQAERLYAQVPSLVVNGYRILQGQPIVEPDTQLTHSSLFFQLLRNARPAPHEEKALRTTQILYAEHGFNASTFAARVTVSTLSDLYSGVVSALGTLKGPLHGGANEAAIAMLLEIGSADNAVPWLEKALAEKRKIMGFGHREYKQGDERARIAKKSALEIAQRNGFEKWSEIAEKVETEMWKRKGLYPNLDFPVALLYYALDIPIPLYTPIFVMSRITGWCAHIIEQLGSNRLIRPQCQYNGPRNVSFVPMEERKAPHAE